MSSASDLEQRAKEAFVDDNFDLAVDLYAQAIELHPANPVLFADRAQANIKLCNFTEAVADANKAIQLDPSMSKAYLRKGVACMKLEEYHTAKAALESGASLTAGDSRFTNLIRECDDRIAEESNELKTVEENVSSAESVPAPVTSEDANVSIVESEDQPIPVTSSKPPLYRHEFYQKADEVVVTVFAKGIPAENVAVEFGEQIMSVTINAPGGDLYHLQPRLFGKIIPEKSRFSVLSTKIEIHLFKSEAIQWSSLEFTTKSAVPQKVNISSGVAPPKPTYPSSKSKTTDWDKLEAQVKKEEKDEKLDGDAALNKLFRDIYRDADEDTRRAMQKSFVESNGTVLSTNWKEVGAKKVEGSAPDGMEMRKWEY